MDKGILLVSFDYLKSEYTNISYAMSSIVATLRHNSKTKHMRCHSKVCNLSSFYSESKYGVPDKVKHWIYNDLLLSIKEYSHIAFGVSAWSREYVDFALNSIFSDYKGKIILAGYEITATTDERLLPESPTVDYFIKGYAESALIDILQKDYPKGYIFNGVSVCNQTIISPYLSNVIDLNSPKIHWETKRGCTFRCGFCEWGNAEKGKVTSIDRKRISSEINLIKNSRISEINIIDATFNSGKEYLDILPEVLSETRCTITAQARFELVDNAFISICLKHRERIKLEFGLQTIHEHEMETIGRHNDISKIKGVMELLNKNRINYEVSIIYGIPGQTVNSFAETIEFIKTNGCKTIRAFPLRIPRNSNLQCNKDTLKIREEKNSYGVDSVVSSHSFSYPDFFKMKEMADALEAVTDGNFLVSISQDNPLERIIQINEYQEFGKEKSLGAFDFHFSIKTEHVSRILKGFIPDKYSKYVDVVTNIAGSVLEEFPLQVKDFDGKNIELKANRSKEGRVLVIQR